MKIVSLHKKVRKKSFVLENNSTSIDEKCDIVQKKYVRSPLFWKIIVPLQTKSVTLHKKSTQHGNKKRQILEAIGC